MMFRSAILSVLLLALSADADNYHRRTRQVGRERSRGRKLGIGLEGRTDTSKVGHSGSKVGGPLKTNAYSAYGGLNAYDAYGVTSDAPTASTVTGRIPIINLIKTPAPAPTSAGGSEPVDGRLDLISGGGNTIPTGMGGNTVPTNGGGSIQTIIGVNGGEGSNTFDNIPDNNEKDDLDEAFEDLFNMNNGGDSSTNDNEGEDESGNQKPPKGDKNNDDEEENNGQVIGGDSSTETNGMTGGSDTDGNSDTETTDTTTNGSGSDNSGSVTGDSTGDSAGDSAGDSTVGSTGSSTGGDAADGSTGDFDSETNGSVPGDSTGVEGTTGESGSGVAGSDASNGSSAGGSDGEDSTTEGEGSSGSGATTEGEGSNTSGTTTGGEGSTGPGATTEGEGSDGSGTTTGGEGSTGSGTTTGGEGSNGSGTTASGEGSSASGTTTGGEGSNGSGVTNAAGGNGDTNDPAGSGSNTDGTGIGGGAFDPTTEGGLTEWGTAPDDDFIPDESTAVFCPNVPTDKEVLVNWIYAVEFVPGMSSEEKAQAVAVMELKLVSEILQCDPSPIALPGKRHVRHRHLVENLIAGLNYMPLDARNENVVCYFSDNNSTNSGVCETYFGRMEMYLREEADEDFAINSMLFKIRDAMQRSNFPAVDGIIRVWYLDPDLSEVDGIADGGIITDGPVGGSYSTGTMIAFAALGVSVFAAIVLGAFRMRRNQTDVITNFDSTVTGGESNQGAFVLPNSYKLDAVAESDDDSRYNGSVIVSEGGFTSDGDSQMGHYDNVLGVDSEDVDDMNNDMILENNTDFSAHRKTNLVAPGDVSLGVRHSGVDVHQCTSANCKICNYQPNEVEFVHKSPTTPQVAAGNFFGDE